MYASVLHHKMHFAVIFLGHLTVYINNLTIKYILHILFETVVFSFYGYMFLLTDNFWCL